MTVLTAIPERRKEPRTRADLGVTIRVLSTDDRMPGHILDLASEGMAVFSPQPVQTGAALAITYRGVLMLAEVVYCNPSRDGFRVGMVVDQALATSDLTVKDAEFEIRALTAAWVPEDVAIPVQALSAAAAT